MKFLVGKCLFMATSQDNRNARILSLLLMCSVPDAIIFYPDTLNSSPFVLKTSFENFYF